MKLFLACFISFILIVGICNCQTNDREEAFYNIGFGAVFGGIGAVINKKKEERFLKVLIKGMGQGALGGYTVFESKRLLRKYNETNNIAYVWPSRLLNSAGNSIMENASNNMNFYERWHLHVGFNRIELLTKGKLKLRYKLMPLHLISFVVSSTYGPLDVERSLKTGVFVFNSNRQITIEDTPFEIQALGASIGNNIIIFNQANNIPAVLTHELIHVYQNDSFVIFNPYFEKPIKNSFLNDFTDRGIFKSLYLDFHRATFFTASWMDDIISENYYNRFFEQEAFYYSGDLN